MRMVSGVRSLLELPDHCAIQQLEVIDGKVFVLVELRLPTFTHPFVSDDAEAPTP